MCRMNPYARPPRAPPSSSPSYGLARSVLLSHVRGPSRQIDPCRQRSVSPRSPGSIFLYPLSVYSTATRHTGLCPFLSRSHPRPRRSSGIRLSIPAHRASSSSSLPSQPLTLPLRRARILRFRALSHPPLNPLFPPPPSALPALADPSLSSLAYLIL